MYPSIIPFNICKLGFHTLTFSRFSPISSSKLNLQIIAFSPHPLRHSQHIASVVKEIPQMKRSGGPQSPITVPRVPACLGVDPSRDPCSPLGSPNQRHPSMNLCRENASPPLFYTVEMLRLLGSSTAHQAYGFSTHHLQQFALLKDRNPSLSVIPVCNLSGPHWCSSCRTVWCSIKWCIIQKNLLSPGCYSSHHKEKKVHHNQIL